MLSLILTSAQTTATTSYPLKGTILLCGLVLVIFLLFWTGLKIYQKKIQKEYNEHIKELEISVKKDDVEKKNKDFWDTIPLKTATKVNSKVKCSCCKPKKQNPNVF